jgi:hypothetical protein
MNGIIDLLGNPGLKRGNVRSIEKTCHRFGWRNIVRAKLLLISLIVSTSYREFKPLKSESKRH